jgi:hypothetical protein
MTNDAPYGTFTCKLCGYTGPRGWSDEECKAEARELWDPLDPGGKRETVCDPCFEEFMAWMGREHSA